ncbi:LOW QUALITY PROTEIN: probable splicing factor YJU2B [Corvus hawaiiensis]|uniref:LOW QUALITY PROTEIN: probable splicing factor YJU2B n=1 Tax=Corvus hawaiiensis TaxID=134902 RepID=UPI0020185CED|nr:LOW QUALITY PROTEIN: probable splicing factor YJU2B [Corvus hawaiiensis]
MGERKGTNKYYPPDFDPAKHGSLNKYHHSHPLRERARKLSQGILVIRFEMPFNIWCDGCQNHIGMGVRYNAEKKKVGTYYTTPVYRFRMKCHLCVNYIELQTDPGNCDYVIVSGARRKEERWDPRGQRPAAGNGVPTAPEQRERLAMDPMFRLEHGGDRPGSWSAPPPTLTRLQEAQDAWKDDFGLNSRLRRRFREEKKTLREEEEEAAALRARAGLSIPLLREEEEDRRLAALLTLRAPDSYEEKQRLKRSEISQRSWFAQGTARAGGGGPPETGSGDGASAEGTPGPPPRPPPGSASCGGGRGRTAGVRRGRPGGTPRPGRTRPVPPPRLGEPPRAPPVPPPPRPSSPTTRTPAPRAPERGFGGLDPRPPGLVWGGAEPPAHPQRPPPPPPPCNLYPRAAQH